MGLYSVFLPFSRSYWPTPGTNPVTLALTQEKVVGVDLEKTALGERVITLPKLFNGSYIPGSGPLFSFWTFQSFMVLSFSMYLNPVDLGSNSAHIYLGLGLSWKDTQHHIENSLYLLSM